MSVTVFGDILQGAETGEIVKFDTAALLRKKVFDPVVLCLRDFHDE